jgi:hypothetical protein
MNPRSTDSLQRQTLPSSFQCQWRSRGKCWQPNRTLSGQARQQRLTNTQPDFSNYHGPRPKSNHADFRFTRLHFKVRQREIDDCRVLLQKPIVLGETLQSHDSYRSPSVNRDRHPQRTNLHVQDQVLRQLGDAVRLALSHATLQHLLQARTVQSAASRHSTTRPHPRTNRVCDAIEFLQHSEQGDLRDDIATLVVLEQGHRWKLHGQVQERRACGFHRGFTSNIRFKGSRCHFHFATKRGPNHVGFWRQVCWSCLYTRHLRICIIQVSDHSKNDGFTEKRADDATGFTHVSSWLRNHDSKSTASHCVPILNRFLLAVTISCKSSCGDTCDHKEQGTVNTHTRTQLWKLRHANGPWT